MDICIHMYIHIYIYIHIHREKRERCVCYVQAVLTSPMRAEFKARGSLPDSSPALTSTCPL